jgi:hypothetical protein
MNIRRGIAVIAAALSLASASFMAFGAGVDAVRRQVESSMLVTGRIQVDSDGTVSGFSLSHKEKLPVGVINMVSKAVPTWKFEPVMIDGKAVNVSTGMNIRLVARQVGDDSYSIAIRSATFSSPSEKLVMSRRAQKLTPPRYPDSAITSGVAGTVYLLIRAGRNGAVTDVIAEQVNLKVVASEDAMAQWRGLFEEVSVLQARRWKLRPPTEGEWANAEHFVVRVPVVFSLDNSGTSAYGRWQAYVPGPRKANPWEEDKEGAGFSPDALAPGEPYLAGSGLRLKTALSGT